MTMAMLEKCLRILFGRLAPSPGRCPMCGNRKVTSRIRRSRIVVDGPTYLEMKCGACGHTWRMLLRAGP
ncbi:MAG: hypothetical protein IJI36_15860 [Kiritimatiellae bacterium]|nr:hypothetical protein [Kiritimatiellia bacterium]